MRSLQLLERDSQGKLNKSPIEKRICRYQSGIHLVDEHADRGDSSPHRLVACALAERLAGAFEAAGWDLHYSESPQEAFRKRPMMEVVVRGFNSHRLEAISGILGKHGVYDIKRDLRTLEFGKENPKYLRAINQIDISVGHKEN